MFFLQNWNNLCIFAISNKTYMEKLKLLIQKKISRDLESPRDFEFLSEQIQLTTNEYLSPTTLKRLFGYIPQTAQPRITTLSILARFLGFNGWQDYVDHQYVESDFVSTTKILTSELQPGQKIIMAWNPDRECIIEYIGNNRFVVLHAINAKMQVGDQFTSHQFVVGQPFNAINYVSVRIDNLQQDTYVAGVKSGLTKLQIFNV